MIEIDKTDNLYHYLQSLGVNNIEKTYTELAQNGRYKLKDIRQYFNATFQPSSTEDVDQQDLNFVLDYYSNIKTLKSLSSKKIKELLVEYKNTNNQEIKTQIVNSKLKEIMFMCLNYKTLHKDVDILDLIQVANIGLLEAIEHFNTKMPAEFNDLMVYWIREKIIKEFEEKKQC